jgi:death-on-curing family protein
MGGQEQEVLGLTMEDLRAAHGILSEVFKDDPEPMPSWDRGQAHLLETCCGCIETGAFGVRKYADLPAAAAKLFYSTIKLHPFPNGNKRFGFVLLLMLLIRNDRHLTCPPGTIASLAKRLSESDPHSPQGRPDPLIDEVATFLAANMAPGAQHSWGEEEPTDSEDATNPN